MTQNSNQYPPLELERRNRVPTDVAAFHLCKQPQTLRGWACTEKGPIRPIRMNGRLLWSVAEIRSLLQGEM